MPRRFGTTVFAEKGFVATGRWGGGWRAV